MSAADRGGALSMDASGCVVLDRERCLEYLSAGGLGRVAVNVGALPAILPVQFALDKERVVFSVGVGTVLHRATRDTVVAFESDGVETEGRRQWSVTVTGIARHLIGDDIPAPPAIVVPGWAHRDAPTMVAVSTEYISGRRTM